MTILICIAIVMVGASVITTYAAMTAKEGYEDEAGFHVIETREETAARSAKKNAGGSLTTLASTG
jgi:hypothetical protein